MNYKIELSEIFGLFSTVNIERQKSRTGIFSGRIRIRYFVGPDPKLAFLLMVGSRFLFWGMYPDLVKLNPDPQLFHQQEINRTDGLITIFEIYTLRFKKE